MKFEWKKQEKQLYLPKNEPTVVLVPKQKFFTISGTGNPNSIDFAERIGILYSLAYAVKMMPKQGYTPDGYFDYTVYPLEGLWDLTEKGRQSSEFSKDELVYTIMIRQPDFVTEEIATMASDIVKKKKPHPLLSNVKFETIEDGLAVQILHNGSYDDEPLSFQKMKDFINENNLTIKTLRHREIYISDACKTELSKLKTVLRYNVIKSE
ncbi:MAG: GyrI-like domain-containing protein [Clostridia bacterium]|nr:GyrI-like domain-containing protein [Clostridia bacterium]MDD4387039.1 GyrI-like domain-containing protein [Clostridia bacterium]